MEDILSDRALFNPSSSFRPVPEPPRTGVMPAGMFSIDSILSGRPSCKEPLLLHRSGPVVLSAGLTDSIYTDYNGLYSATCGPSPPGIQSVNGTRIGYNGYYYGQLHVQGAGGGPPCCSSVPGLSPQQCPCIPAGRTPDSRCLCTDSDNYCSVELLRNQRRAELLIRTFSSGTVTKI